MRLARFIPLSPHHQCQSRDKYPIIVSFNLCAAGGLTLACFGFDRAAQMKVRRLRANASRARVLPPARRTSCWRSDSIALDCIAVD